MENIKVTYQRDIDHCKPTTYVKQVTISKIVPALNSDFLECISFNEMGWNAISKKGLHKEGDKVWFIPAESVLPFELSEELEITNYTSKGRVRVVKLRGNRSEGLIINKEIIEPYLPYIMKWEDLPSICMEGKAMPPSEVSYDFHKFYKMENILNAPYTFEEGEEIFISEKLHGTSSKVGILKHPITEKYQLYIGSYRTTFEECIETIYHKAILPFKDKLPKDIVFLGEVYGTGIQDLTYGVNLDFKIFAATKKGQYLNIEDVQALCIMHGLPIVKFDLITYKDIEQIRELADQSSEYTNKHVREGVVITSKNKPDKMAKCISFKYLTRNSKNKTERK